LFNALKHAFTTAPILTHFIPDTPIIVETDASDYAVAGILSITCADGEIHPIAYYSWTLTAPELNYDTHDKELLAIFEAFWNWRHYLEGSASPIDVVTDHKNLEYFSTSKVLSCWQARWSEFLSQFNLVIRFRPGKLGAKPDALTRQWDVYPKEGDSGYARVNPKNLQLVFTQEQLTNSLRATYLEFPVLRAVAIMDVETLHSDILSALPSDPIAQIHLADPPDSRWSTDEAGFLRLDGRIYILDNSISMDFIEQLPSSTGFTAILVVVDRLSKQAIFIPTHDTITSPELAKLFLLHVFSKHGVPAHITSDRGTKFISHFFRSLGKALDMHLHFTSAYHLEGDGQTERSNQTLEQYLRIYCNYQQDNWADLLPLVEFAYNNAPSATTGVSPFFANKGYHPSISVYPERDMTSARARDYAVDLESLHQYLREEMANAQL